MGTLGDSLVSAPWGGGARGSSGPVGQEEGTMFAWGAAGTPEKRGFSSPHLKRPSMPAFLPLQITARPKIQESRPPTPAPPFPGPCSSGPPPRPTQQWLPGDGWEAAVPGLSQAGRLGTAQLVLTAACRPAGAFPRCRPAVRCAAGGAGGWNPKPTEGELGAWDSGYDILKPVGIGDLHSVVLSSDSCVSK